MKTVLSLIIVFATHVPTAFAADAACGYGPYSGSAIEKSLQFCQENSIGMGSCRYYLEFLTSHGIKSTNQVDRGCSDISIMIYPNNNCLRIGWFYVQARREK